MPAEVESMAYSGNKPWHGFGFYVENLNPEEMLKAAKLDWSVSKRPLFTAEHKDYRTLPAKYSLPMETHFALVRDTDNLIFGVCGPDYIPFQNSEVFDFFRTFTDAGKMKLEVAGSLRQGKNVFALAKIEEATWNLMGCDENYTYLLLSSPHIWGEALDILFTNVRVVCWNTLTMALSKKTKDRFRFAHRRTFTEIRTSAEMAVAQAIATKEMMEAKAKFMAETKIEDQQQLFKYFAEFVQPGLLELGEVNVRDFNRTMPMLVNNFVHGPGSEIDSSKDTWWGAFNAYTRYADFQRGKSYRDYAVWNAWMANTEAVKKRKAFDRAYEYAQAA